MVTCSEFWQAAGIEHSIPGQVLVYLVWVIAVTIIGLESSVAVNGPDWMSRPTL